jgi:hypothetical protein
LSEDAQDALARAERACAVAVSATFWRASTTSEKRKLLTAYLVHRRDRDGWQRLKLRDPFREPANTASSFYKRYIQPGLASVQAHLRGDAVQRSTFRDGSHPLVSFVLNLPQ